MAIPSGAVKIVLAGTLPEGEHWESGFWMIDTGINSAATATAFAELIAFELNASDSSGAMTIMALVAMADAANWEEVRVYAYTGAPTATYTGQYDLPTKRFGSAGNPLPNQISAVLTLRTGLAGRRHRGRMYLPCSGVEFMTSDGQIDGTAINTVIAGWAAAFSDLNASSAGTVVVVSAAGSAATPVTQLSMDTRFDVQRRRANKQVVRGSVNAAVTS